MTVGKIEVQLDSRKDGIFQVSEITKYDKDMVRMMKDPVKWVKAHLTSDDPKDKGARWYQEQILRHPHNRIALRCGRRIGKCIEENQRIMMPDGSYQRIKDLVEKGESGFEVASLDKDLKQTTSEVVHIQDNGFKPTYKLTTQRGNEVILTGNHPVLTIDGWVEVDDIEKGEYIATPKSMPRFGTKDSRSDSYIRLLAHLIATGKFKKDGTVCIKINDKQLVPIIQSACISQGIQMLKSTTTSYNLIYQVDNPIMNLFRSTYGGIPQEVFTYSKEKLSLFITSFFDAKGWIATGSKYEVGTGSKSKSFLRDLSHLLLRFGITPNIMTRKAHGNPYFQMLFYRVPAIKAFEKNFFPYSARQDYFAPVFDYSKMKDKGGNKVPKGKLFEEERKRKNVKGNFTKKIPTVQESTLQTLAEEYNSKIFHDLATSDIYYDQVISKEYMGERQTYDVSVPETHNLVVEDIFVHNTWTMIAHMLWVAFTCNAGKNPKGSTCLVATPYDSQARLIFDEILTHVDNSESLRESIESKTKNPYYIKFKNGSVIKLFTAGTKSGSSGGSMRGQRSDWLYMDKTLSLPIAR